MSRQLSAGISDMSAVWPPIGIAVGAGLVLGRTVFPVYALTLSAWFLHAGYSLSLSVAVSLLEATVAFVITFLLHKSLHTSRLLSSLSDTLRFYASGCVGVMLPFSAIVTLAVRELGYFSDFFFADVMLVYWLSESLGVMLFAPLAQQVCYALVHRVRAVRLSARNIVYIVGLLMLVACNYVLIEGGQYLYGKVLTYFYFPLLAWVAISRDRWLAPASVALVGVLVPGFVVVARSTLEAPGFALLEAVIVVFVVTVMTQLVQAVSKERNSLLRRFEDRSQRDLVTGLKNDRGLLNDVLERRRHVPGTESQLVVVELSNFDEAHDLLDESFSVRLEKHAAAEIRRCFPDVPVVARLAQGQFGFFWAGNDTGSFDRGIERIISHLNGQVYIEPEAIYRMFVAVGSVRIETGDDPARALSAARQMAAQAATARDYPVARCTLDDPRVQRRQQRLKMLEELKEALSSDRLVLFAQEIRKAEGDAGKISFEVLLRMKGRDGSIISPAEFLPVAEDYGLSGDVDRWVVKAVHDWAEKYPHWLPLLDKCAINLSGMTLADPGFHEWLRELRQRSSLPARCICFEVTETQMISDWNQADGLLKALREDGHRISLDDFGTGLATFEYLTRFPLDYVKIDGRFVRDVVDNSVHQSIIRAITDVATTMQLQTIAEFVGDRSTRERVAALGVDFVQGFAIAKPVPLSELMLRFSKMDAVV
jgi:EAL domain-containing protein (putative c-di-GMP-specific phosphodiesterase class I)/integral membrane sensor domain MASE1